MCILFYAVDAWYLIDQAYFNSSNIKYALISLCNNILISIFVGSANQLQGKSMVLLDWLLRKPQATTYQVALQQAAHLLENKSGKHFTFCLQI